MKAMAEGATTGMSNGFQGRSALQTQIAISIGQDKKRGMQETKHGEKVVQFV